MSIARVTELSAVSDQSFEDAINQAINRATSTLRNVEGAWVKDMNVLIENGNITGYKVNVAITFVLEDAQGGAFGGTSEDARAADTPQTSWGPPSHAPPPS